MATWIFSEPEGKIPRGTVYKIHFFRSYTVYRWGYLKEGAIAVPGHFFFFFQHNTYASIADILIVILRNSRFVLHTIFFLVPDSAVHTRTEYTMRMTRTTTEPVSDFDFNEKKKNYTQQTFRRATLPWLNIWSWLVAIYYCYYFFVFIVVVSTRVGQTTRESLNKYYGDARLISHDDLFV